MNFILRFFDVFNGNSVGGGDGSFDCTGEVLLVCLWYNNKLIKLLPYSFKERSYTENSNLICFFINKLYKKKVKLRCSKVLLRRSHLISLK